MHLHILPSLNPDGFALKRRGNANNIDLNRDFPDQVLFEILHILTSNYEKKLLYFVLFTPFSLIKTWTNITLQFFPMNNDEDARQPETRAIMTWLREMHFTASATLHGVILVFQSNL